MRTAVAFSTLTSAVMTLGGCPFSGLLQPDTTTVLLVNNGEFDVEVELFISDSQEIPRDVLTLGDPLEYVVSPGQPVIFSRDCDDLQAIVIDNASLRIVGDIGPEADTDVLRDGDDFGCGSTIQFTFTHPDLPTDLDISVTVTD